MGVVAVSRTSEHCYQDGRHYAGDYLKPHSPSLYPSREHWLHRHRPCQGLEFSALKLSASIGWLVAAVDLEDDEARVDRCVPTAKCAASLSTLIRSRYYCTHLRHMGEGGTDTDPSPIPFLIHTCIRDMLLAIVAYVSTPRLSIERV